MPRKCTICGTEFEGFGGHCPDCVTKALAKRQAEQAAADRRMEIHIWRQKQERRQRRDLLYREWREAV